MSVPVFANALRTHSRLRVLTATRVVLPTTRNISSLVTFRTAVPKNASFSVSRSFTTSQIARNELKDGSRDTPKDASGSTIFVWNIPRRATEEDLAQVLSEFGRVTDVRLHMYQSGRHRGTAHVDFASNDGAVAIKELADRKPIEILDRRLLIKIAHCKPRIHEPNEKLYVKGCAGDESEIRDIFQQFSDSIVKISLLKNPGTAERSEVCFVTFNSIENATKAMEALNDTQTPDGKVLAVHFASPTKNKS